MGMESTCNKLMSFFRAYLKENFAPRIRLIGVQRLFYCVFKYYLFFKILKFEPTLLAAISGSFDPISKNQNSSERRKKNEQIDTS